ncbi:MAG: AAA family ATPase [Tepidisphaeraceae bacterium]
MKRIVIIGCCGAGKSTLASRLGERLGLPVVHLDRLFWKPGWVEASREEFDAKLATELEQDAWIIDGNYGRTIARRLAAADTAILLRFPTITCLRGIISRRLKHGRTVRADMADGCPERFNWEFFRFVMRFNRDSLPGVLRALDEHRAGRTVIELHSHREVDAWLATVAPKQVHP